MLYSHFDWNLAITLRLLLLTSPVIALAACTGGLVGLLSTDARQTRRATSLY